MNSTDQPSLTALAEALRDAQRTRRPIPQPSAGAHQGLTLEDAYAVQRTNLQHRLDAGERVIGHKIGLTSRAMQEQLGVDQPDFGVITDAMAVPDGGTIDPGTLVAPKLEAEYAFRISRRLSPEPSPEEVRDAIDGVAVAIELIDSRIADWQISLVDTVADNASSAAVVVGPWQEASEGLFARILDTEVSLRGDGSVVAAGPGSAVLGDPVLALHWLARAIGAYGGAFAPGDTVLAGAVSASVPLDRARVWEASAPGFAPVCVEVQEA